MTKAKPNKRGCGKLLQDGDWVAERGGVVLCEACDDKVVLAVHIGAYLRQGVTIKCGQRAEQAREVK